MKKRLRNVLLTALVLALVSTQTIVRAEETITNKGTTQQEVITEVKQDSETSEVSDKDQVDKQSEDVKKQSKLMAPAASSNITTSLTFGNDQKDTYEGGDTVTIYSQIIVSSTSNDVVKEDSYFKIYVPKTNVKELKPDSVSIDTAYYKSATVTNDAENWIVIFKTKSLAGGTNVALPVVLKLLPNSVENGSKITIRQELYGNDNSLITSDKLDLKGKAYIEKYTAKNSSHNMTEKVVDNKIPAGTKSNFFAQYSSNDDNLDSRTRRIYATIPDGYNIIGDKYGSWTKDTATGKYYRDLTIKQIKDDVKSAGLTLDVSGVNLANHTQATALELEVKYEVYVIKNGAIQNDLAPSKYSITNSYFVQKSVENDKWIGSTQGYVNFVDKDYRYVESRIPFSDNNPKYAQSIMKYSDVENGNIRLRMTHMNLSGIKNQGDNTVGPQKATLKSSTIDVPEFVVADEFRISYFGNLNEQQRQLLNSKINGTKVYGVTYGTKTLLGTVNEVAIGSSLEGTFNNYGWVKSNELKNFKQLLFEYPGDGLELSTEDGSLDFLSNIHTDALFSANVTSIQALMDKFNSDTEKPDIQYRPNVTVEASAVGNVGNPHHFIAQDTLLVNTYLEYADVSFGSMTVARGEGGKNVVFPGEKISIDSSITAHILGQAGNEATTENGNMYYIIPEGFDVIMDGNPDFSSIKVMKNFFNGQSLVIAKPNKELHVISEGGGQAQYDQINTKLHLRVNERSKEQTYKFKAAYLYDNNKLKVVDGKQYGLKPVNSFNDAQWREVLKNADNRPETPTQYIDLREGSITVKPPKIFSSYNDVRTVDKSGSQFASSTGRDAIRGSKIEYQWSLVNDSPADIKSLTVVNVLPYPGDIAIVANSDGSHTPRGSQFKTPLTKAMSSDLFDIYYSVDEPLKDVKNEPSVNWVSSVSDYSKVTMIKAVLKSGQTLRMNETAKIVSSHEIPNNPNIKDNDIAFNNFALTLNEGTTYMDAPGAEARVYLERADVVIEKVDEFNKNLKLEGAQFSVYDSRDRLVLSNLVTNSNGNVTLPNLAVGESYYLIETKAPAGYIAQEGKIPFTVKSGTNTLQVINSKNEKTSVTVTKEWVGGPDVHPTISVQLFQNGNKLGAPVELENGTNSYTWSGLNDKDPSGNMYIYTVDEVSQLPNYKKEINGTHIINKFVENKTINISGTKTWEDASNKEGLRPGSIKVRLHANGTELNLEPTWVKDGDTWTYTFENVPEKENGTVIQYTITEDEVANYTSNVTGKNITNSRTVSKRNVTGTKTWVDNNDSDGLRPETVEITLFADGTKVEATPTWNTDSKNVWSYTYTNLDKYANGKEIEYTVEETKVDGYDKLIVGLDITNTHKADTKTVSGTKVWDDNKNQDGIRPDEVSIILYANGQEVKATPIWTNTNKDTWNFTYPSLPKFANGAEITYTVDEKVVPDGYTKDVQEFTITNSHTPSKIDVTGTKTWDDNKNQDGIRPGTITVKLYADGTELNLEPTWVKDEHSWNYTFAGQPEYKGGQLIKYTVTEEEVPGYTTRITGRDITNSHKTDTRSVTGVKTWDDAGNIAGFRPEEITVKLHANGTELNLEPTWTKAENTWTYTFENLPEKENGVAIEYTVTEEAVEHYITDIQGLNITNSHTPSKIDVTGTKTWDDNKNQDGIRPDEIKITLYANGEKVTAEPTWVKGEHSWNYTFAGQPEYKGGQLITYTVTEDTVPGYTPKITGLDITNTHKADTRSVTGVKTWDDASNIAGFRPEEIEITLYANGEKVNAEPTWTKAENTWTYEFANLEVKENGIDIEYTVTEEAVEHYTTDIQGLNITNSHTPSKIDVTGTKTWDDNKNQDGIRPEEIKITLHANGEEVVAEPTWVKGEHSWNYTFAGQPEYKGGQLITYTVTEDTVPGYTPKITGLDITNTHKADTRSVTGVKTWGDASNIAGFRPEEIEITLYANGEKVNAEPTWTKAENTWTYEFANLEVKENGIDIEYTVTEEAVEHYITDVQGLNITNSHTPSKIDVTGTKTWDDNKNQDGIRPEEIKITLHANGEEVVAEPTWVKGEHSWNYTFAGQPEYKGGQLITYTVTEDTVPGYTPKITGLDITNTHKADTRSVTGVKTWDDASNIAGFRPEEIEITLYANGEKVNAEPTWTKAENTWTYEFANLDVKENGVAIEYTVTEEAVEHYTTDIQGLNITNSHTPSKIDVEGTKTWKDSSDQDGKRPETIVVTLYANGEKVDVDAVWSQTDEDVWNYVFADQPEYKGGELIEYTVKEDDVVGYTTKIEGLHITNSRATEVRTITGTKVWNDNDNQDGIRPENIVVKLIANGKKLEVKPEWIKNGNTWSYKFANLPKYANKEIINYVIEELSVDGYTAKITDYNLVNTHEVSLINIEGTKTWDDHKNQDGIRPEAVEVALYANGEKVDVNPVWTQTEGDVWHYVFENQPEFKAGEKITYTVDETEVAGYVKGIEEYSITNTHKPSVIEIKGQKEWVDESNQDGLRPEAITVTLFKNGEAQAVEAQWTKAENIWSYTFGELPEYENGEKLVYTITEEAVAGYTSVVNGLNLVNTHEVSLIDLEGQKVWNDNSNKENKRPESIIVNLYANGEKVDVKPEWTKENDTWNYTFKSLPEFKAGAKIIYTVDEEAVANYESAIDGFTITNTVKETVDPEKPNPEKPKPILPGTGVASDGTLVLAGLASIIGGLKLRSKSRKKEEEEA